MIEITLEYIVFLIITMYCFIIGAIIALSIKIKPKQEIVY